jgi:hypothetical protein
MDEEIAIVQRRVADLGHSLDLPLPRNTAEEIARVVAMFRELRDGKTADGKIALKTPTGSLSTAEAIALLDEITGFGSPLPHVVMTGGDPLRIGERDAEMGLVLQMDCAWQDQTGAPADPQADAFQWLLHQARSEWVP